MTTKLKPMPKTVKAIRERIRCVLYDFHPAMASSTVTVMGRSAEVSFYGYFLEQQYRDALKDLPWDVRIVPARHGLRVEPAPEISDDAAEFIDEDSRHERAADWAGMEPGTGGEP